MTAATTLPQFPWLSLLIGLPLAGALLCLLHRRSRQECRWLALATTLATLAICIGLFVACRHGDGPWLLREDAAWIPRFGIRYTLGLDGLSLLLTLLTAGLHVVAVLLAWPEQRRLPQFLALLLVLESGLMGVFLAVDLVLFYLFWEVMLLPMLFLIGIWGGENRRRAAVRFFLYTLAGSLAMLVAMIALYLLHGAQSGSYSFALADLLQTRLPLTQEYLLFGGFMLAFAIKAPLVPFHTWQPDALSEAPANGAVDVTGLLLKTGIYGMIRFAFPLFPNATRDALPLLAALALVGLFHAAWSAYRQDDVKRILAYSSISHLGLVLLGLAAWNTTAWQGSVLLMVTHGIVTGALFAVVAMLRSRTGTRNLNELGGLWGAAPQLSACFLFFALASLGLPGLANFAGEILVLLGTFRSQPLWALLALPGLVFTAAYLLRLVQGTLWGPAPAARAAIPDLTVREWLVLLPLIVLTVWLGLAPAPLLAPLAAVGGLP
ncbi:MAG: NADH-quinone oxidoreductase subunit M [Deltaproteobacteria bacterium]|nr:MAG: NADH-quinone oxidoreductase subunit M [Deltaproteobacteria bacterium]